jgi:NAD(P)H-dependent FMN reductase
MTSVLALSTSQCPSSLNHRGLKLLNVHCNFTKVDCLSNYDIPVVNVNGMNDEIPLVVSDFIKSMYLYDKFVFAIPEFTGMMSSSTKNLLDWLVVCTNMNLDHGKGYPWTDKHVILLTFTPSGDEGGSRHMAQTKEIFKKLGANVIHTESFTNGWNTVIPENEDHFIGSCNKINNFMSYSPDNSGGFKKAYDVWNKGWVDYANK